MLVFTELIVSSLAIARIREDVILLLGDVNVNQGGWEPRVRWVGVVASHDIALCMVLIFHL